MEFEIATVSLVSMMSEELGYTFIWFYKADGKPSENFELFKQENRRVFNRWDIDDNMLSALSWLRNQYCK